MRHDIFTEQREETIMISAAEPIRTRISDQTIAEVRSRISLTALVRLTQPLTVDPRGDWHGLCPHCKNAESLVIRSDRGAWLCGECDRGGDAVTWVMDLPPHRREFAEAVSILADLVGVKVRHAPVVVPQRAEVA